MNEIPTTMTASVLRTVGEVALEQRPVPTPAADEVLVRVSSVGVCGSDVHYFEHGRIGPFVVEAPLILGHELSGEIVAVGADVDSGRIGERVAVEPQRPCRTCDFCKAGQYNLCPDMEFYATPPIDGAFAEYVTIQNDFAFALPESISDDAAALLEPLSVGIAAVRKGRVQFGDTVFVAGAGPIGLIAAQVARSFGAARVVVSDLDADRRALASSFGFSVLDPANESSDDMAAHVFIDATGATPAIVAGVRATRSGGTVVLVGSADSFPLDVGEVAMREINVTGIFRYTNTWPTAIDLVARGLVDLDSLVSHRYGIEQVEEALTAKGRALKRIVCPGVRRVDDPEIRKTHV